MKKINKVFLICVAVTLAMVFAGESGFISNEQRTGFISTFNSARANNHTELETKIQEGASGSSSSRCRCKLLPPFGCVNKNYGWGAECNKNVMPFQMCTSDQSGRCD